MARRTTPAIRKLPSGRWQARPTINGQQTALGTYPTAKEAAAAIEQAKVDARNGTHIPPNAGKITLHQWATGWTQNRIAITANTRQSYTTTWNHLDQLAPIPLTQLTPQHIKTEIARWHNNGLAASTIHLRIVHIRAALNAAIADNRIAHNPATHPSIELPRKTPKTRRYLTHNETVAVTAHMTETHADLTWTMAWTGFRYHETVGLTPDQIDLDAETFILQWQYDPKTRSHAPLKGRQTEKLVRHTPIAPDLLPLLQRRAKIGWLFPNASGQPVSRDVYAAAIRSACIEAGVAPFTPHDLRHTCASWLHAVGVPLLEASKWLGHKDPSITSQVYTHLWASQMSDAAVRMGRIAGADLGSGVSQIRRQA